MPISNSIPPEDVAAGLTKWAARQDGHVRAAVELLIRNGWHRISAFRKVILRPESQGDWYVIRWSYARRAFDNDEFVRIGGSRAGEILDFAIALGENRYGLNMQGPNAAEEMIEALCTALGFQATGLAPVR